MTEWTELKAAARVIATLAALALFAVGCGDDDDASPPPTVTPTALATATDSAAPTATNSATVAIDTATSTPTETDTPEPAATPTATVTEEPTATPTSTNSPTATATAEPPMFGDLGDPLPDASAEQLETFLRGQAVAAKVFTAEEGLGPDFNVSITCAGCHEKPVLAGSAARYRDFLLVHSKLPDGSSIPVGINGVQPQYTVGPGGRRPTDPETNLEATRNPIPFFGVGLLAELDDLVILAHEDADDLDGDGISGRANYDRGFVGRFGRKAQTVSIEGFIRGPLFNHLGITTVPLSDELKARLPVPSAPIDEGGLAAAIFELFVQKALAQVAAPEEPNFDDDGVADPELSEQELFDLVSFSMLLAAPRPDPPTPTTEAGAARFEELGCAACHVPALEGPRGPVPAYSDLLLHDMGEELADDIVMGLATGSEFRTQPWWGIGVFAPYLHDGRADTLDEAIRWHGGEGAAARDAYEALDNDAQEEVIAFLRSLGGSSQFSTGLLPPNAPIPPVGELGGPVRALDPAERALFEHGRSIFDTDKGFGEGTGPLFNGDSCRACHFQPVIGGAGFPDVDVIRHGELVDGEFIAPDGGTIAPRHSSAGVRPPIDENANVSETRQTPPLFGLGFLESIPEEAILANADCDNPDPQAVSGCAHRLPSGALGRLGWKANVPSLAEFARDAMSAELGITLPAVEGMEFGKLDDEDLIPDPEIGLGDLDALTFFMQQLAPPAPRSTDPEAEQAGAAIFEAIGCADCHLTEFVTPSGLIAYTDLLLHQIAPDGSPGVPEGQATALEIRTPPLWGLALTAPYMHDGRSFTIGDAIDRHEVEADASRVAYEALSEGERAQLLAFLESI